MEELKAKKLLIPPYCCSNLRNKKKGLYRTDKPNRVSKKH